MSANKLKARDVASPKRRAAAAVMDEIWNHLEQRAFRYVDLEEAEVHCICPLGVAGYVCVIGHDDGLFEWVGKYDEYVGRDEPPRFAHSDHGWGSVATALREGLVAMVK